MPVARYGNAVTPLREAYLDRLLRWSDIQEYLPYLHKTAGSYEKVRVLELGTRSGNSTSAFLAAAEAAGGHVWSGDVNDVELEENPFWTFILGDDMNEAVQAQFPSEVDVFFLDTSHEYEHTLAELWAYMPRVVPGGIALFHDTNLFGWEEGLPKGVWVEAKEGWAEGIPVGDNYPEVRQALDEYCRETGLSWENLPGVYGLGKIRL